MKKLLLVPILFLLANCGRTVVDPAFAGYPELFNAYAAQYGSSATADGISIGFYDGNGTAVAGHCENGKIEMVRADWEKWTAHNKEGQMMHEFGHCALHRAHLNTKQDNGLSASLMNKFGIGELYDEAHKDYYLNELFTYKD